MTEYVVERAAAALPSGQSAHDDLFTVSGGRVIIKRLIGVTTTSVTNDESGFYVQVVGSGAMQVLGSSVSLNGVASGQGFSHEGVAAAPSGRLDIVIGSGFLLRATVSGTSTISGSAAWTLVYEPLDPGAKVEAA